MYTPGDLSLSCSGTAVEDYLWSINAREREWSLRSAKPTRRNLLFSRSEIDILPREHLQLLQTYNALVPCLAPPHETAAILRRQDLNLANVFIDPDSKQIVGIIDWQGATIRPSFIHAR
jgi:Ser/Thr protein kinase RdoA (MazF antagonist)